MRRETLTFDADDKKQLFVYRWAPDEGEAVRGVVHVAHGMAEHAARYERFAEALTRAGFVVYADDHRGHGKSATADELGFFAAENGFHRVVSDIAAMLRWEREREGDKPLVLFGHSMGSYISQAVALENSDLLRGLILSGSNGKPSLLGQAGRLVARAERLRLGPRGKSSVLRGLTFEAFNKAFAPARTGFDWLSRDPVEVDKYIADPLSGFDVTVQLWIDVLDGMAFIAEPERVARIRKDLPIFIFSGAVDAAGENTKGVQRLIDAYKRAGIAKVEHKFYPAGRHEMLNETNRDEVTSDVLAFLQRIV
jgi:alpha-beta hydrolase superfamily lysophospholipase